MSRDALMQRCRDAESGVATQVRLGDVCELNMGQSPESESYNTAAEGVPFYQGNADFGPINPTPRVWCNSPVKIAEAGDLLISVRAPIGALNFANERCCIGRGLAALRVKPDSDSKFIYYALKSNVTELNARGTGSTFKAINKKALSNLLFPLPPLAEQRRIAAKLDRLCDIIAKRKQQLVQLQQLVKSRFVEMFGEIKYPERELITVTSFIDYRGKTPTKSDSGIPLITAKNVRGNGFSVEPREYMPEELFAEWMTRGFPRVGDVLFTTEAPLGNVCRIPNLYDRFAVGQRIVTMQVMQDVLDSSYLEHALKSDTFQRKIKQKSSGSTVTGIRSKLLEKLTVPIPPLALQREFAAFVAKVDGLAAAVKKGLEAAERLYRQQLQEAFA